MRTQATASETCSNGVSCSEDQRIVTLEQKLQVIIVQNKDCQRLLAIPGIGPVDRKSHGRSG